MISLDTDWVEAFDGTKLCVQSVGIGPPFVLANGLGGSIKAWRPLIEHFADQYRFVSWDYRGLYRSVPAVDRHAVRIVDHARDLHTVIEAQGLKDPIIAGWSMGVQVMFEYALTFDGTSPEHALQLLFEHPDFDSHLEVQTTTPIQASG